MNRQFPAKHIKTVILSVAVLFISSCDRNRNNPGWDYFPDMFYSTAYESYSVNPNFADGLTMRLPVPGTVARDMTPFDYSNDPESRVKAGKELLNPFKATTVTVERGKWVYTTFCTGCHGVAGKGDGKLYTSGLYLMKPLPLVGPAPEKLKDGEIFHTITLGLRSMGAHGSQITPDDRWKLILYIRKLQEEKEKMGNK